MDVKKLIVDTFIEIGTKDSFDNISINKIVKACNISRTTFYYYFKDLPDVIDYYLDSKFSAVSSVCAGLSNMQESVEYGAEKLIYNFPELKELLHSKWREPTEIYLHMHWKEFSNKMVSSRRKDDAITQKEKKWLTDFIAGAICDYTMHGNFQETSVQEYAKNFSLLLNARHAIIENKYKNL